MFYCLHFLIGVFTCNFLLDQAHEGGSYKSMSVSISVWNLVSVINMTAYHLRRSEIEYELKIRGIPIEGNADELRKRLSHAFSSNVQVNQSIIVQLNPLEELETCEERFSDLSKLVTEFEGNAKDNEYKRIQARLWHWYLRVEKIPIPASLDTDLEDRKSGLLGNMKRLVDGFNELAEPSGNLENNKEGLDTNPSNPATETTTAAPNTDVNLPPALPTQLLPLRSHSGVDVLPQNVQPQITTQVPPLTPNVCGDRFKSQTVPVYKWGLKYDGDGGQSVAAFLERAEELSRARGVSFHELYESAVDLFSGTALIWYRSACRRIFSWGQLKEELKVVFQSADYDDRLHLEILHRTQGDMESLDLYLAAMDGLFGRLSIPVSEDCRLQRILKNVNTFLQDKLCMFNITSLDELRRLGRRAEVGRLRSSTLQPPPRPTGVLEPDLACSSHRRRQHQGTVASLSSGRDSTSSTHRSSRPLKCWNCGDGNHTHRNCHKEKTTFCFGCGKFGIKKPSCSTCQPKNVLSRSSP